MLGTPSKSKQTGQAVHKTPNFLNTIMKNMEGGGEKWKQPVILVRGSNCSLWQD